MVVRILNEVRICFMVFRVLVLGFLGDREKLVSLHRGARWARRSGDRRAPPGWQVEVRSDPRLHDIAESARIEGGAGVVVDREEDEAGRPLRASELACCFDAVKPRHGDIEDDDVRMKPLRLREKLASIAH